MKILGIETSCDETAAAVVEDGFRLLSNVVSSSVDLHTAYGGVVPEIAARSHIEVILPVIHQALEDAKTTWDDIDVIAVTQGPGLGGSLLIGVLTARTLAIAHKKPLYAVNHVEAHVYANFLTSTAANSPASRQSQEHRESSLDDTALGAPVLSQRSTPTSSSVPRSRLVSSQSAADVTTWQLGAQQYTLPRSAPTFPLLALIVSGKHSQLVLFRDHFDYQVLGVTHDDAVGEAFDKVAKMTGLPYPGGPSVAKAAQTGDGFAYQFPKAKLSGKYDFSYSGLKTAVLRAAQETVGKDYAFPSKNLPELLSDAQRANIAASFRRVAIETLVDKTVLAVEELQPVSVVIAGGVAADSELRRQLSERLPFPAIYTDMKICTDNGAMVATLGCFMAKASRPTADPYSLAALPSLQM